MSLAVHCAKWRRNYSTRFVSTSRRALGYLPALDGLRALAVAAVVVYHLGYSAVPGGFIGVEVFFVLSGWLVCALLDAERREAGRIDLKAFWLRRARRLLPAVTVVIAATMVVATFSHYDRFVSLRGDALAAMAYVLNWRLIFTNQSYFEAALGPSPLQHLWSLSIEEQYYLALPLLLGVVLVSNRTARHAPVVLMGLTVASTVWRFALEEPGVDPSRIYYGTDTRAAGLLIGATLGLVWVPNRLREVPGRWAGPTLDAAALASLVVIGRYTFEVSEHDPEAFGASLTAVQIATIVLIATIVHPAKGLVAHGLSVLPLRWVGQRSYGIYLWHWPIIVALAAAPGEQPETPFRSVLIVALTLLLAAASYRWIEQPIRQRGLAGAAGELRSWLPGAVVKRPVFGGVFVGLTLLAGAGIVATTYHAVTTPKDEVLAEMPVSADEMVPETTLPPAAGASSEAALPPPPVPVAPGQPVPVAPPVPAGPPLPPITGIGDSVMLGAEPALTSRLGPTMDVEAKVGRQMIDSPALVSALAGSGQLGEVLVLHLGANGPFPDSTLDEVVDIAGRKRKILLLNVKVPRRWEGEVNDRINAALKRHRDIQLVDWRSVADAEPGLLTRDGYHLTATGMRRYTDVVAEAVAKALEPVPKVGAAGHRPA